MEIFAETYPSVVEFHSTKCISRKDYTMDKIEVIKFKAAKDKPKYKLNCKHLCSSKQLWYFNYLEHMQASIVTTGQ